jgi:hypothetical protein
MEKNFRNTGKYEKIRREHGHGDRGTDITLISSPFDFDGVRIPFTCRCLVQVKPYAETMTSKRPMEDLRNAFEEDPEADCGLVVSTATDISEEFRSRLDKFSEEIGKPVDLLYGSELVRFILKHL